MAQRKKHHSIAVDPLAERLSSLACSIDPRSHFDLACRMHAIAGSSRPTADKIRAGEHLLDQAGIRNEIESSIVHIAAAMAACRRDLTGHWTPVEKVGLL